MDVLTQTQEKILMILQLPFQLSGAVRRQGGTLECLWEGALLVIFEWGKTPSIFDRDVPNQTQEKVLIILVLLWGILQCHWRGGTFAIFDRDVPNQTQEKVLIILVLLFHSLGQSMGRGEGGGGYS